MFKLFRKTQSPQPSAALRQALLLSQGLPPGMDPSTLRVGVQRGSYSGRKKTRPTTGDGPFGTDGSRTLRTWR